MRGKNINVANSPSNYIMSLPSIRTFICGHQDCSIYFIIESKSIVILLPAMAFSLILILLKLASVAEYNVEFLNVCLKTLCTNAAFSYHGRRIYNWALNRFERELSHIYSHPRLCMYADCRNHTQPIKEEIFQSVRWLDLFFPQFVFFIRNVCIFWKENRLPG